MGLFDVVCDVGKNVWDRYTDPLTNFKLSRNSFIDNVFKDHVKPEDGSVVLCDLTVIPGLNLVEMNFEHTGIYVGYNEIIHRDGDGYLERVSPKKFIERLGGLNAAMSIYVACRGEKAIRDPIASGRATRALHDPRQAGYDLLGRNCHHFTRYCVTGKTSCSGLDFTFGSLQILLKERYRLDCWRVWDFE